MDALRMLLLDHARSHGIGVGEPEGGIAIAEGVLYNLKDDLMRRRPGEGMNSMAWLIWHMARAEDMAVNLLVAGRPQVLQDGDWAARLGVDRHDVAAGMTDEEVGDFSERVDISALRAYRDAVGKRSIEVISAMQPDELDEPIDHSIVKKAFSDGTISENAGWLDGFMQSKTKAFVLGHTMTAHNFMHLGEAFCLRSLLGMRLPV